MPEDHVESPNQHYIHSTTAGSEDRTRVLKHGDTFAVFNRFGDVHAAGRSEYGLFNDDTRFLSKSVLHLGRQPFVLLSSAIKKDNALLVVDLTNPDLEDAEDVVVPRGTLHVYRSQVLWENVCYSRVRIHNYSSNTVRFPLSIGFAADFADIFEVRGEQRARRGQFRPVEHTDDALVFAYEGLDDRLRRTRIHFPTAPTSLADSEARYDIEVGPQGAVTLEWSVTCEAGTKAPSEAISANGAPIAALEFERAANNAIGALRTARDEEPVVTTANEQFNSWLDRSLADLHMLRTDTPHGPYPYAGVPWFSTAFGRDGILTALQCLWLTPSVGRGVLGYLAATQAESTDDERDAQPGKILHETRAGEMARLGEVPFAQYYGSVDATPLFVVLAGAYYERTGDLSLIRSIWPNIKRALHWIDEYGDVDGDGFVEYARQSERGLVHQGWKDSHDSVFHEDGTAVTGPVALCEVQGYVYAAKKAGGRLAHLLGQIGLGERLEGQAEALADRFEDAFWDEDLSTYALALDGDNRPCRLRTSNAGHCLYTQIAGEEHAKQVADTLMSEPGNSGWGVRTLASTEARYNPMSYHNGSVWPHDNAIVAAGLGRYGFREEAARILGGLFDASLFFDLRRLPELFCGFSRRSDEGPTLYPQACIPQAWAAATPLLCLQACLGLEVNGAKSEILFRDPLLPPFLEEIEIRGLRVGFSAVDLRITRYEDDVSVRRTRRVGDVDVVVVK